MKTKQNILISGQICLQSPHLKPKPKKYTLALNQHEQKSALPPLEERVCLDALGGEGSFFFFLFLPHTHQQAQTEQYSKEKKKPLKSKRESCFSKVKRLGANWHGHGPSRLKTLGGKKTKTKPQQKKNNPKKKTWLQSFSTFASD